MNLWWTDGRVFLTVITIITIALIWITNVEPSITSCIVDNFGYDRCMGK